MEYNEIEYLAESSDDFPPVSHSDEDGLLAMGGNLEVPTLLKAYGSGIFPWFEEWSPIMWFSPRWRCIFPQKSFKPSKSLNQKIRNRSFQVTADMDFEAVIRECGTISRNDQAGTWIENRITTAYVALHKAGYAHSIEVWSNGSLAGGLYGVSLGKAFFGESMFHHKTDASKVALYYLCNWLDSLNFEFVDAQMATSHLLSLGGKIIKREHYLVLLEQALKHPDFTGSWKNAFKSYYDNY